MPPFGQSTLLSLKSNPFFIDSGMDNNNINPKDEGHHYAEILRSLDERSDEGGCIISAGLRGEIKSLVQKAATVNTKIKNHGTHTLGKVVEQSIGSIVLSTMDQVSNLLDSDDNMKQVLQAIVSASVSKSSNSLEKLEELALGPVDRKLDSRLQHLFGKQDICALEPRVSLLSSEPAFEFVGGESVSKQHHGKSGESLPLHVSVTPITFINSVHLLELDHSAKISTKYKVEIGKCTHVELFTSAASGVVGEARVQLRVTPIDEEGEGGPSVFEKNQKDVARPRIVDVRACQQNVFPRKIQTRLDICCSSSFGSKALDLLVKMRTRSPPQGSGASKTTTMDVQLVLEPAWLQPAE